MNDKQIIDKHDVSCRPRARMELKIVNQFIRSARKANYKLRVEDIDEESQEKLPIKDILFDLDEAFVTVWDKDKSIGWVHFVFGNDGYDCICNYTLSLENFLKETEELASKLENGRA